VLTVLYIIEIDNTIPNHLNALAATNFLALHKSDQTGYNSPTFFSQSASDWETDILDSPIRYSCNHIMYLPLKSEHQILLAKKILS
jgi:hypothetical protein